MCKRRDPSRAVRQKPPALGGFRGMGEGGTIGAPAAIANAVSDALSPLGIEVTTLPITPDRIFRLVEAARAESLEKETHNVGIDAG